MICNIFCNKLCALGDFGSARAFIVCYHNGSNDFRQIRGEYLWQNRVKMCENIGKFVKNFDKIIKISKIGIFAKRQSARLYYETRTRQTEAASCMEKCIECGNNIFFL